MNRSVVISLVFILIGVFSVFGGALDWDFFMENRRARLFVMILGRLGARIFYVLLGIVIFLIGIYGLSQVYAIR